MHHVSTYQHAGPSEHVIGKGMVNLSDKGLNLSGSWQQGHSATYNTRRRFYPPLGGNYNSRRSERCFHRTDLANATCLWERSSY
ncbi:unnamed protein product [Brassica napus]|uniref:(rape) hypothetical protein n=1 Tax=Brassica napus TaxID=3708 RepID=A0A816SKJ3_BRANA|nr:unnamed protein product [Brassica napus]